MCPRRTFCANIPVSGVKFKRERCACSGHWHGEVMIHRYTSNHLEKFLRDVHTLSKIRHENIALFMGACMEPPNLAVVTCIRTGDSLHTALRTRKLSYAAKIHIAKQVHSAHAVWTPLCVFRSPKASAIYTQKRSYYAV
jgi:serine/threonine protein kinase